MENRICLSQSGIGCSRAHSLARIVREYNKLVSCRNTNWFAQPLNLEDPYEWHFVIRGPPNSVYEEGIYHGKILLPPNYPLDAPKFFFLHKNGRFEVGKPVCFSVSKYHPDLWQPSWEIQTMLNALQPLFLSSEGGILHCSDWAPESRRILAAQSVDWVCPLCKKSNREFLSEMESAQQTLNKPLLEYSERFNESEVNCSYDELDGGSKLIFDTPNSKDSSCITEQPAENTETQGRDEKANTSISSDCVPQSSQDPPTSSMTPLGRSPRKLTFGKIVSILIVTPVLSSVAPLFQEKCLRRRILYMLDILTFLLVVMIIALSINIFRRPGAVLNAFFF